MARKTGSTARIYWLSVLCFVLVLDLFLYSSGINSATFFLLGGWFPIAWFGVMVICAIVVSAAWSGVKERLAVVAFLVILGLEAAASYLLADVAKQWAAAEAEKKAVAAFFTANDSNTFSLGPEDRAVLAALRSERCQLTFHSFVPTEKTIDLLVRCSGRPNYIFSFRQTGLNRFELSFGQPG